MTNKPDIDKIFDSLLEDLVINVMPDIDVSFVVKGTIDYIKELEDENRELKKALAFARRRAH